MRIMNMIARTARVLVLVVLTISVMVGGALEAKAVPKCITDKITFVPEVGQEFNECLIEKGSKTQDVHLMIWDSRTDSVTTRLRTAEGEGISVTPNCSSPSPTVIETKTGEDLYLGFRTGGKVDYVLYQLNIDWHKP